MDELRREIGVKSYRDFEQLFLIEETSSKICFVFGLKLHLLHRGNPFCTPEIQARAKLLEEEKSKITKGQITIVHLLKKLIENKEDELKSL